MLIALVSLLVGTGMQAQAAGKVCAIPLLRVPSRGPVDSGMLLPPRGKVHFEILQVIPPAPACEGEHVSFKK